MILDILDNAAKYVALKAELSEGFGFLDQPGIAELEDGTYEINGDVVYAIVQRTKGRDVSEGKLEAHRQYLDIQYVISGEEFMGWTPRANLPPSDHYDEEKDLEFFEGAPQSMINVPAGSYAIFLPSDTHLPCIGTGDIHKVVVKIAID